MVDLASGASGAGGEEAQWWSLQFHQGGDGGADGGVGWGDGEPLVGESEYHLPALSAAAALRWR